MSFVDSKIAWALVVKVSLLLTNEEILRQTEFELVEYGTVTPVFEKFVSIVPNLKLWNVKYNIKNFFLNIKLFYKIYI